MSFAARLLDLLSKSSSKERHRTPSDNADRADYDHMLIVSIPLWFEEETISGRCHDETLVRDFEVFLASHHLTGTASISSAYGAVSIEQSMRRYKIPVDPSQARLTERLVRDWFEQARNIRTARRFLYQTAHECKEPGEADMYRRMIIGVYLYSQEKAAASAIDSRPQTSVETKEPRSKHVA